MTTAIPQFGNLLPSTEESKKARAFAFSEIEKLDDLLTKHGHPRTGFLEKPMLVTYIMAKQLGLLTEAVDG